MLARTHRFHGRGSLRFVYEKGKTVRSAQLSLRYCLNERRQSYRTAVVVSKKVQKTAVARNRIRRRVYEIVRGAIPNDIPAYDLVFTVFSDQVAEWPSTKLEDAVHIMLKEAGISAKKP